MLKLYYSPGACSLTAHIALEEIGVPYEKEIVRAGSAKGTGSESWRKINPKGYVPALLGVPGKMGGTENLLTEANAILVYLARKYPAAKLLPPTPEGEGRCLEWLGFLSGTVHGYDVAQFWRPQRFVENERRLSAGAGEGPQFARSRQRLYRGPSGRWARLGRARPLLHRRQLSDYDLSLGIPDIEGSRPLPRLDRPY